MNDKNLKRANYSEAIDQIEAALAGEDPSPINTQPENDTEATAEPTQAPKAEEAAAIKPEDAKATAKSQPATQKTEQPAKAPAQNKKKQANNAQPTTTTTTTGAASKGRDTKTGRNIRNAAKTDEGTQPPPQSPPPQDGAEKRAEQPDMDSEEVKPEDVAASTDAESPTSRSGRKIKPKK